MQAAYLRSACWLLRSMIKRLAMSEPGDAEAVKAKKTSSEPSGAPRWTYVVAAIA